MFVSLFKLARDSSTSPACVEIQGISNNVTPAQTGIYFIY